MYILCTSICKKKRNIDLHIFLSILFDIIKKKKKNETFRPVKLDGPSWYIES